MKQVDGLSPLIPEMRDSSQSLVNFPYSENHSLNYERSTLARSILFACEDCDGPMVPISHCIICKKTSHRRCVKCASKIRLDIHKSCECLALLGSLHASRKKIRGDIS